MKRLRELRREKGISLKELGAVVNVAESTMSLYENGKRQPDYETLFKLADFFDVTVDYLLRGGNKNECLREKKLDEKDICEAEQLINLIQQLDPIKQKGVLLILKGAALIPEGSEEALYK